MKGAGLQVSGVRVGWRGVFAVLILSAIVCAAEEKPEATYIESQTGVVFPAVLGGLQKGNHKEYDTKELGLSVPYSGTNGAAAEIYLYSGGQSSIPSGTNSALVREELEKSVGVIMAFEKMGAYQDVVKVSESGMKLGSETNARSMLAVCLDYSLVKAGKDPREARSYLLLCGYKNLFLKIRFTFPRESTATAEKNLASMLEELGRLL